MGVGGGGEQGGIGLCYRAGVPGIGHCVQQEFGILTPCFSDPSYQERELGSSDVLVSVVWIESHASMAFTPTVSPLAWLPCSGMNRTLWHLSSADSDMHLLCSPMWLTLLYESNIFSFCPVLGG